jgi:hypothetical protein
MAHRISSRNLSYHADDRRFTSDASSLLMLPGLPMPRHIEVVSERTGNVAHYTFARAEMVFEDLGAWHYSPDPACPNANKTAGITIWND